MNWRTVKETKKSIYDELRRILSAQTTQEGNPIVLYLAKFMTSTSIVVQRESVGCLAELAQVGLVKYSSGLLSPGSPDWAGRPFRID